MTGIGEFIKVAESKGSKNKFKDTKRIDDEDEEEDDYQAAHTNSVYPQCSGDKAHVCRFGNEQISKFTLTFMDPKSAIFSRSCSKIDLLLHSLSFNVPVHTTVV